MAAGTHVWLANPATRDPWEFPNDEYLQAFYRARGWEPCDPPADEDEVAPVPEPKPKRKPRSTH
jgi:hypothetical protein